MHSSDFFKLHFSLYFATTKVVLQLISFFPVNDFEKDDEKGCFCAKKKLNKEMTERSKGKTYCVLYNNLFRQKKSSQGTSISCNSLCMHKKFSGMHLLKVL